MFEYIYNGLTYRYFKFISQIRTLYYKNKNKNKKRVLVFTDSRGYEVTKPKNRKNAYSSYVKKIIKQYNTDFYICPEHSTTLIDFLYQYKINIQSGLTYDYVIAHIGIVDFSPRPLSMLDSMMQTKLHKLKYLNLPIAEMKKYQTEPFPVEYYGQKTKNFYSENFFIERILSELKKIDKLILIGCNEVDLSWRGNYWRERPENINIVLDYNKHFYNLDRFLDLSHLSLAQVHNFTVDNVHLNSSGFNYIYKLIENEIQK